MNRFGHNFRLSLWGESHGPQIGLVIDGVPPGIPLTQEDFMNDLARRRAGAHGTTPRHEKDTPQLVSGVYRSHTTGAPLTIVFANKNIQPQDYKALADRPSHADRVARERFEGFNDPCGGGHFSGRLTLALVAAGVVAKKILPPEVTFSTAVAEIGGCTDPARFESVIQAADDDGDSVGGIVECLIDGIPTGWGEPFFDSVESHIAQLLFAIPGVKGAEFGAGFSAARMRGSEHNDPILDAAGRTASNHAGGIVGGLTNGNELIVRAAFKPTASIAQPQQTFDPATGSVRTLSIGGRHDICIALRGAVVVEAAVAIALADLKRP